MADIHVDSAGSATAPYETWAKAATSIATAAGADAAGDRILMGSAYSETAAGITGSWAGTVTAPTQLLSGTKDATSGITALTAGAVLESSTTTNVHTGNLYAYGITFRSTSASSHFLQLGGANNVQRFEDCSFVFTGTGGSSSIQFGAVASASGCQTDLDNCTFRFAAAGQTITAYGDLRISGGAWLSGGTSPTAVFKTLGTGTKGASLLVEGFDFSNLGTGVNLVAQSQGGFTCIFRDCILPTGWTGSPIADAALLEGHRVELWNYKVGSTWYRAYIKTTRMTMVDENTIVMTGGADDGAPYSLKMTTTANCAYPVTIARSPDLTVPNTTTGSSITVTVQIIHDSATALEDDEIWLEVEEPDGTVTTDAVASVIAAPAAQTASGATWTTTGMANPNAQELSVTINPSVAGPLLCRVMCAKPSKVVYIDPAPVVA